MRPEIRLSLLTVLLATTPAALRAQTAPCLAANAATTSSSTAISSYSLAGQNYFAWRFTPPASANFTVQAAKVYTRNASYPGDAFLAVELWDEVNGEPGNRLGGGVWEIDNTRAAGWRGANFDRAVTLQPGVPTWFVFVEPGFTQLITEPNGTFNLTHVSRAGTGAWSAATTSAPKFQLFCNLLDDQGVTTQGQGCPLSTGEVPTAFTNEPPTLGNSRFAYETCGNPPGGAVFAVIGGNPNFTPLAVPGLNPACMQNTDSISTLLLFAGNGDTRGPDYKGHARLGFAIPNSTGLANVFLAIQMVPLDLNATSPLPFATSNALRLRLY